MTARDGRRRPAATQVRPPVRLMHERSESSECPKAMHFGGIASPGPIPPNVSGTGIADREVRDAAEMHRSGR